MHAIREIARDFAIIEFLVESGADVNFATAEGYTPLHVNMDMNGPTGSGEMPYLVARLLKKHGANLEARNHYGWTPLLRAALEGTADEFKALLEVGADIKVEFPGQSMPVFTRGRPLAVIVLPQPKKLRMLLEAGLKPTRELNEEGHRLLAAPDAPGSLLEAGVRESLRLIEEAGAR